MQYQSPGAEKCKGAIVTQDPPHYVRTPWHVNASGAYRRRTGHMPKRSGPVHLQERTISCQNIMAHDGRLAPIEWAGALVECFVSHASLTGSGESLAGR